ncbi:MAG TPA: anthranilate/aminodeoxychorismate synthase component II [Gammaproteobacteria bacterium]|jgi:anthranilate synthase component II|nr:anthranilate/aminodeoxychorismate synthase component II [Gammaproteobacteria bacterium]
MLVMIDNYDSFTYNLVQYLGELGEEVRTFRNDEISVAEIAKLSPDRIMVSPGPGTPDSAGVSLEVIKYFAGKVPLMGVCLGHQSIGQAFGGKIVHAIDVMHGKTSMVEHNGSELFANIPSPYRVTRYHSLVVERKSLPAEFEVTAWTSDGEIMGLRHREMQLVGVQYHPESILTEHGHRLLQNFLEM